MSSKSFFLKHKIRFGRKSQIPGCSDPGYNVPGYGSPIYIPGFGVPVYSPGCGYVCPANNPSGEITELKISGLSHSTGPYRCRPGPNMHVNKDYTYELLPNFVSTMQDKHKNKHEHLRHGEAGGGVGFSIGGSRRFGIGHDGGRGTGGLVPLSTISRTLVAVSMDMVTLAMDPTLIMAVHLDEVMYVLATILVDESLSTISQDYHHKSLDLTDVGQICVTLKIVVKSLYTLFLQCMTNMRTNMIIQ
ncbi:hypothetical protein RND71_033482 [Anisodus tanguticus]|uniref:Uncharacterized protein n=1 Tax=Anisodus tanguticus TaxID=243964 RepID=A0AAE1R8V1_9SOLA|nr:hypothetical protein RND71_033482 [Anisodus tanguticus]